MSSEIGSHHDVKPESDLKDATGIPVESPPPTVSPLHLYRQGEVPPSLSIDQPLYPYGKPSLYVDEGAAKFWEEVDLARQAFMETQLSPRQRREYRKVNMSLSEMILRQTPVEDRSVINGRRVTPPSLKPRLAAVDNKARVVTMDVPTDLEPDKELDRAAD